MSLKNSFEYIKKEILKSGYKLLSEEYVNALEKIKIKCDKGHQYESRWNDFQQGHRCPICSGTKKLTYTFVKSKIEKENYKLLSKEYKNAKTKMLIECPKEHVYYITWSDWKNNRRCPICNNLSMFGSTNPNWKGGVSSKRHLSYTSKKYKIWRLNVFERDNFTCQVCKDDSGGNLNAHHLITYKNNDSFVYDIWNGITVCEDCHIKWHKLNKLVEIE